MKTIWTVKPFLQSPAGDYPDAGGGNDHDDLEEVSLEEDDDDEDDEDDLLEEDDNEEPEGKGPVLDPLAFGRAVADGLRPTLQNLQQPQQQRQLTTAEQKAELKKLIGSTKVGGEFIKRLRDGEIAPEDVAKEFETLMESFDDRVIQLMGLFDNAISQRYEPRFQQYDQREQERKTSIFVTEVTKSYPALKQFGQAVRQGIAAVNASGAIPKNKTDALRMVAIEAGRAIKAVNPQFKLTKKSKAPKHARPAGGGGNPTRKGANDNILLRHFVK